MNKLEKAYRDVLDKIAALSIPTPKDAMEWAKVGQKTNEIATEALKDRCPKCGK